VFNQKYVSNKKQDDFISYWNGLGFFENIQSVLPPEFFILFEIARNIFTEKTDSQAMNAVDEISSDEVIFKPDRDDSIRVNRIEKPAPLGNKMEIDFYKNIHDLKNALPRELAFDDEIFSAKLFTKTLLIRKFYETESDRFKSISTSRDKKGKDANKFEQKFYILMDRSNSMETKMRLFYTKCIVAELLRRKLNTNAKLFYRAFDTEPGKLFKIEKKADFNRLIEKVMFTTTKGRTNIQKAILQAVKDIKFEKEMLNTEILIVTDGISKIDKYETIKELGSIKLNVLKIGHEFAEMSYFDVKSVLDQENIDFDPSAINLKKMQENLNSSNEDDSSLSLMEQRAYRRVLDFSNSAFKDLKEISSKYIEIDDLNLGSLFTLSDENYQNLKQSVENLSRTGLSSMDLESKKKLYKQAYLLYQYLDMLSNKSKSYLSEINSLKEQMQSFKQNLLGDPVLLFEIMGVDAFDDDKKLMKLAKKDAKKMMKEMEMKNKKLSLDDMKKAKMLFSFDVGEGSMGQFILLLFVKLFQILKKIILFPFNFFKKTK